MLTCRVVIATRNRAHLLVDAVRACQAASGGGTEIVVVDSASRGHRVRAVANDLGVQYARMSEPGASRARNHGAVGSGSDADLVVFTDDDCRPRPDWLRELRRIFDDPAIGFATGAVAPLGGGSPLSVITVSQPSRMERPVIDDLVGHGANLAVRRSAFADVGGFDPVMGPGGDFPGAEDLDLMWRLVRAGWPGIYHPAAVVDHLQWRGRLGVVRARYGYGSGRSALAVKASVLEGQPSRRALLEVERAVLISMSRAARGRDLTGFASQASRAAGSFVGWVGARRRLVDAEGRFTGG